MDLLPDVHQVTVHGTTVSTEERSRPAEWEASWPSSKTDFFALDGDEMRVHAGRSVVALRRNGQRFFLKRFWTTAGSAWKRSVAVGLNELRMIDWLNDHGFAGPNVVRRGEHRWMGLRTRLYFLMIEVPNERPLEAAWRRCESDDETLIGSLARQAARLHDAGFIHTDFSERHILVNTDISGEPIFRLIDLERAWVGRPDDRHCAADLATLQASVNQARLRARLQGAFVEEYLGARTTLRAGSNFRELVRRARPTRSFS